MCDNGSVVLPLPPSSNRPFLLDAAPAVGAARRGGPSDGAVDTARGAALLLHGYTGSPYEVLTTAHAFAAAGFHCRGPLLRGHGHDPAALNRVSASDWLDDAVAAYDALPAGPRVVVGCSMGGLLALRLSLLRPVDALVLLAPALRFHPAAYLGVAGLTAGLWRARPFIAKEGPGGDVGADDGKANNPTYKVLPTRGLVELWRLQLETEKLLPRVTTPLCTLHGDQDHTIAPSSSAVIAAAVSSPVVEHHRLPRTQHLVALDSERDLANALALQFVASTLSAAPTTKKAA